jgi:hypothetical protein
MSLSVGETYETELLIVSNAITLILNLQNQSAGAVSKQTAW